MDNLKKLYISHGSNITDSGVEYIKHLKNLEEVTLLGFVGMSDRGLRELLELKGLRRLHLGSTRVSESGEQFVEPASKVGLVIVRYATATGGLEELGVTPDGIEGVLVRDATSAGHPVTEIDFTRIDDPRIISELGLEKLSTLTKIKAGDLTDDALSRFAGLSQVRDLEVLGSSLTDAGFECLGRMSDLRSITLSGCDRITDGGFDRLSTLDNLETIDMWSAQNITDAGLDRLRGLPRLKKLSLYGSQTTESGVLAFRAFHPNTEIVGTGSEWAMNQIEFDLKSLLDAGEAGSKSTLVKDETRAGHPAIAVYLADSTNNIPDDQSLRLCSFLTELKKIEIMTPFGTTRFRYHIGRSSDNHRNITDVGLKSLKPLGKLIELDLSHAKVTDEGLVYLQGLTRLQSLNFEDDRITDVGLARLGSLAELKSLDLSGTSITNQGLANLEKLQKLERLSLAGTQITDAGIPSLAKLANLRRLQIPDKISEEGKRRLQDSLPGLTFFP